MRIEWTYDYTLGTLYQHSAKLTETLVISPFFVLERSSGKCLWQEPESAVRSAMLFPRAFSEGVILAEKCEMRGRNSEFSGIHRFDARTGVALNDLLAGASSPARLRGYAGRLLLSMLDSRHRRARLDDMRLLSVQGSELVAASGEVVDLHSGKIIRRQPVNADSPTRWSPAISLDPLATVATLPGIGELYSGQPDSANTELPQRFQDSWPLHFSLQGDASWRYYDHEAEAQGRCGTAAFDLLLPPFAYFLLYRIEIKDEGAKSSRALCYDLSLRRFDLRTGKVTDEIYLAEGPIHKWPSVVDVDELGAVVLWRDARTDCSTIAYLSL